MRPTATDRAPAVVVGLTALVVGLLGHRATSWHYFHDAARLLFATPAAAGGGLDVFRFHPEFQFGPLSIAAAAPFALLPPPVGVPAAIGAGVLLGAVAAGAVAATVRSLRPGPENQAARLGTALAFVALGVVWADVAVRTAHLDDAVALAAVALACAAVARDGAGAATAALIVAAAAKPWAIAFAPLALVPAGRHRSLRLAAVLGGAAVTWLPFVLDEPRSVTAAGAFQIRNAPSSALRVLGVHDPATPPWTRPAQVGIGLLVALLLVRRGRWVAVPVAVVAVRLVLDPGTHHYYAAGIVLATLMWERVARPLPLPAITVAVAVVMEVTPVELQPGWLAGVLRLATCAALLVLVFSGDTTRARPSFPSLRRQAPAA